MEKRKRRTKEEIEAAKQSNIPITRSISPSGDVNLEDEGDSEGDEEKDALSANFIIFDGKRELKVKAYKDYWALQSWVNTLDADTREVNGGYWVSFKYFANLGQLANRVFDFRLKNSDVSSLNELTDVARKLAIDIKKEFEVNLKLTEAKLK